MQIPSLIIIILSCLALIVNHTIYQYNGCDYISEHTLGLSVILALLYLGAIIQNDITSNKLKIRLTEFVIYCYSMLTIAIATYAAQMSPFTPIDHAIVNFESKYLHLSLLEILIFMQNKTNVLYCLSLIYGSLVYEMTTIPILLIIFGKYKIVREYNILLLISTLIGFTFYYFFPTAAPSSIFPHEYFTPEQITTSYKFWAIHAYHKPHTLAGGMISMPSFHVIWAYYCIKMLRPWKFLYYPLAIFNSCIVVSCVLLGWHYVSDILGSIIVIQITRILAKQKFMNLDIIKISKRIYFPSWPLSS